MRNLFAFLWKYHFFVLFVILEIISVSLLFNSYSYHRSLKHSVVSDFTGNVFSLYSNITEYFSLKQENDILVKENAYLRNELKDSFYRPDTITGFKDTLYKYIPAKVVSNSVNKPNNFMLINKGRKDGLEKEMGVVSPNGVAGIIVGVSNHYSVVMSLLHQNTRLSARIKKNGQLVNLVWQGVDYTSGKIVDIPSHVILQRGDTVITSGNSLIFPEGILVGTILKENIKTNEDLGEATLKFSTVFNTLQHVYVIKNMKKTEQLNLLEGIDNE